MPTQASNAQGMTFDSAPVSQTTLVPVNNTPASSTSQPLASDGGMTFDAAPVAKPIMVTSPQAQSATAPASAPATISATTQPSGLAPKLERWADNVAYDLEHGTDLTGVGHVLKAMGVHGVYNGNSQAVGDFMASLPLGLLKGVKGEAELTQSGKRWQGVKNIAGGALDASTIPGAFIAPEAAEAAPEVLGKAGDAVASAAGKAGTVAAEQSGKAVNAIKKPFSLKAVQESLQNSKEAVQQALQSKLQDVQNGFHDSIRDLFNQVASEAGVKPKPAESLNDVAANTAAAVKAKASAIYKQLDQAVGGTRSQAFDEQLSNVKRALRNSAGIDPDADGRLVERINDLEDAKAAALDQAKAAGVDPKLIDHANAAWRQGSALEDLSKHIQASTNGLRADLAQGVNAAPEALSPAKLATRANRLYNTGRLQQALGDDHADDLLKAIETTKQSAKDAAENAVEQTEAAVTKAEQQSSAVKTRRLIGGAVAASAGATPALAWLKHLVGE